jgi:hypothetical protein
MPYSLSKDYKRLWQELQRESIVCFADWTPPYETSRVIRDVCQTKWDGKTASACCRGVTYAWADNEADFVASCQEAGIEAVFPSVACPHDTDGDRNCARCARTGVPCPA